MEKVTYIGFVPELCNYDPIKDINPVAPNDSIDLKSAFASGFIPENVVLGEGDYDNNDNPESIVGRPANAFDSVHLAQTMKSLSESKNDTSEGSGE